MDDIDKRAKEIYHNVRGRKVMGGCRDPNKATFDDLNESLMDAEKYDDDYGIALYSKALEYCTYGKLFCKDCKHIYLFGTSWDRKCPQCRPTQVKHKYDPICEHFEKR